MVMVSWLEVVAGAVQAVLREKEWRRAFLTTGIMEKQVLKAELEELRQQRAHLRQQIKVNRAQTKDANRRKKKLLKAARQLNVEDLKSLVALKAAD
ncbi:unnamed protein product [Effrenium voratum]|uniref:Uncharacterized protein n=1 Tax=Effrenium voratum TaxID=2562239 RepID=A0AA36N0C8_9DINO|nr:unnamed protein product [Effrenium voratum]